MFFIFVGAESKQQNGRSLRGSSYNIHKLLNSIRFSFLQSFYHFKRLFNGTKQTWKNNSKSTILTTKNGSIDKGNYFVIMIYTFLDFVLVTRMRPSGISATPFRFSNPGVVHFPIKRPSRENF